VAHRDDSRAILGYLDFEVSVTAADDAAVVRISGDLDCYTAPQLRSTLVSLVDDGARHLTIDIAGSELIDSTGLSVLVGGMKRLRDHGGCMVVKSPTPATRRVFEITGLDRVLEIS
jgi:anti-sigma B factor antagonist